MGINPVRTIMPVIANYVYPGVGLPQGIGRVLIVLQVRFWHLRAVVQTIILNRNVWCVEKGNGLKRLPQGVWCVVPENFYLIRVVALLSIIV
jgi:hypothetical protein